MRRLSDRRRAGVTLIELMIATAILVVVTGMVISLLLTTNSTFTTEVTVVNLDQHARWVMDRIVEDVRNSVASTRQITQLGTGATISFRPNVGYFAGAIQLGNTITYQTQTFAGEVDDGVDNNANGLVDERCLVRIQSGVTTVVSPWVREGGFILVDGGQTLTVTLMLEKEDAAKGLHRHTISSQMRFRNP